MRTFAILQNSCACYSQIIFLSAILLLNSLLFLIHLFAKSLVVVTTYSMVSLLFLFLIFFHVFALNKTMVNLNANKLEHYLYLDFYFSKLIHCLQHSYGIVTLLVAIKGIKPNVIFLSCLLLLS